MDCDSVAFEGKKKSSSLRKSFPKKFATRNPALAYFPLASIIGAEVLNDRVRDGIGCDHFALKHWDMNGEFNFNKESLLWSR